MIYTARQLEDLYRAHGQIVLPYRAKLTPLAKDWIKAKEISVGYAEASAETKRSASEPAGAAAKLAKGNALPLLWWSDGPGGPARAAVESSGREIKLEALSVNPDIKHLSPAVKLLVKQIAGQKATGAVLLMKNPALGLLYANRSPALRAVTASTLQGLNDAINAVAPNVLVIEHARLNVQQIKNLIVRFARPASSLPESLINELKEMAQCA